MRTSRSDQIDIRSQRLSLAFDPFAHQQAAQSEKDEARLAAYYVPKQTIGFIAIDLAERLPRRRIEQVHQLRIIPLPKMVQRAADQPVRAQLAAQSTEFMALSVVQESLRHAERAAKSGYDSTYGGNLDLRGCVSNKINFPVPDSPPYWHPAPVDRNACALPLQRLQLLLLQKPFERAFRVAAVLTDHPKRAALGRFGDQPVKVGRIIRYEPDARRIWRAVFRQAHDGLDQWHGLNRRPARSARHAARGAIRAYYTVRVQFLALAAGFNCDSQAARVRPNAQETRIEGKRGARLLRLACQCRNQARAFNDEIRPGQSDVGRAAVGEQFEPANLVDDAFARGGAHLAAEVIRDDQCARRGLELRLGFQHADGAATTSHARGREESRSGATNYDDFPAAQDTSRLFFSVLHSPARPMTRVPRKFDPCGSPRRKPFLLPVRPVWVFLRNG